MRCRSESDVEAFQRESFEPRTSSKKTMVSGKIIIAPDCEMAVCESRTLERYTKRNQPKQQPSKSGTPHRGNPWGLRPYALAERDCRLARDQSIEKRREAQASMSVQVHLSLRSKRRCAIKATHRQMARDGGWEILGG